MFGESATPARSGAWRPLLRDVAILIFLVIVTFQLFGQAGARQPEFSASDIHTIEGQIAGFTTVDVSEEVPGRSNREQLYTRSAMQLVDYPPNLRFYIPGSRWRLENDISIGADVRLEITDDPAEEAERARAYPEATYAQPIVGLQIDDRVYFQASDSIDRAEGAASRFRILGIAAIFATLGWGGWLFWSRRREIQIMRALVMGDG